MHSAEINKRHEDGRSGGSARVILHLSELAHRAGESAWRYVRTLWTAFVEILREWRELEGSLRAKSGYSGSRED